MVTFIRLTTESFVGQYDVGAIASGLEVQGHLGFVPAGFERLVGPGEAQGPRLIERAVLPGDDVRLRGARGNIARR